MKSKQLLAALALPMLFAACSQEELTTVDNSTKVDLSNRPAVTNVSLNLGSVDSRLSVAEGKVYAAQWDENDGVGACIIDAPLYPSQDFPTYPTADEIADAENGIQDFYTLVDYISSNYKYSKAEDGKWYTPALMVEGNYMFYAPHSESFITRMPAIVKFPAVQNVDPKAEIRNSSIQDFYQAGNPVVVGYEFLAAAGQDATISPKLYNVFAYPKFTLKNSYKDENGKVQDLSISKIVIKQNSGEFVTEAYLSNRGLQTNLSGGEESVWTEKRIETAATSDILGETLDTEEEITVNFGEGLTVKAGAKEEFFIVFPAEDYRQTEKIDNKLSVEIYTTDNKMFASAFKMKSFVLNPGNAYPAEEYNTKSQTLKDSKGTLATIEMKGTLIDLTSKNTGIKNNEELINYITNVAKRFDDIREVNDAFVTNNTFDAEEFEKELAKDQYSNYYYQYNPQLHFTLHKDAKIVIDDELIDVLIDQLGDADLSPSQTLPEITFLGESVEAGKIKLGNLTKYADFDINYDGKVGTTKHKFEADEEEYVWYAYLQNANPEMKFEVAGEAKLSGELAFTSVVVPTGSTLVLAEDLDNAGLTVTNNGGVVTYEGGILSAIINNIDEETETAGVLNMNASSDNVTVTNAGIMNVKGGDVNSIVTVGAQVINAEDAVINNGGILSNVQNAGVINVTKDNSTTIAVGGVINNNAFGIVQATDADVIARLSSVPVYSNRFMTEYGINHVIFENTTPTTINNTAWTYLCGSQLTKIELNGDLKTPDTISAENVTFVFNNDGNWGGTEVGSIPSINVNAVIVATNKTVKVNYLNVTATTVTGNLVDGNNGSVN